MSNSQLIDLHRFLVKTLNQNQILILVNVPRSPISLDSILKEASRKSGVALSVLKKNAKTLRDLNLIRYDEAEVSGVELTELGWFVTRLLSREKFSFEHLVKTSSGLRPLDSVIRDLRKNVLRMIAEAGSGHLGASLSAIDVLAVLYFLKMRHDPSNPSWPDRDRLVLSKGHAAPALYAVLAEAGYFPVEELWTVRRLGSRLQGHPNTTTPGVDVASGSLGQCLSVAVGMALAAKMDSAKHMIYVLLGDGELNEGQVWEAALTASQHRLDNVTAIVDRNQYQLTGRTENVKALEPLSDKWRAFGWKVEEADGNDPMSLLEALDRSGSDDGRPHAVIARTTKGSGVSFMEGNRFSNKVPSVSELHRALTELS